MAESGVLPFTSVAPVSILGPNAWVVCRSRLSVCSLTLPSTLYRELCSPFHIKTTPQSFKHICLISGMLSSLAHLLSVIAVMFSGTRFAHRCIHNSGASRPSPTTLPPSQKFPQPPGQVHQTCSSISKRIDCRPSMRHRRRGGAYGPE